jgi:dienelactone hydrolase
VRPIAVDASDTGFDGAPGPAGLEVTRELARLTLDGAQTVVQITRPATPGRFPALIFAHGAGTGNHTAFDEHAEALAGDGIVCLAPDKDLAAYTSFRRDYGHMARQYAELRGWAATQGWADPERLGYYGESEGAWVVPWAAAMSGAAFVALVSPPVVTPREQGLYALGRYLEAVGAPESVFDAALGFAGAAWPRGWMGYVDFDSVGYLAALDCPVLVVYGTADISMPVVQGAQRVIAEAPGPVAVRYYEGADHGLRVGESKRLSPDFLRDLSGWLRGGSMTPRVAGPVPVQPFAAVSPPPSGPMATHVYTGAAGLLALGVAGMGLRKEPRLRLPLALVRFGAVATVLAHAHYLRLLASLATSYRTDPKAVRVGHRLVRLLGLATVAAGTAVAVRARRSRSRRALAAVAAGLGGAAALLSLAGRWGAFGRLL